MANRIRLKGTTETSFDVGLQHKFTLNASSLTSGIEWIIPNSNGSSNDALVTDGAGNLSWAPVATVTGSDTQIFFNSAGALTANADLTIDNASTDFSGPSLNVGVASQVGGITMGGAAGTFASTLLYNDGGSTTHLSTTAELQGGIYIEPGSISGIRGAYIQMFGPDSDGSQGGIQISSGGTSGLLSLESQGNNMLSFLPNGAWYVGLGFNTGTAGQVLTSAGATGEPTWSEPLVSDLITSNMLVPARKQHITVGILEVQTGVTVTNFGTIAVL